MPFIQPAVYPQQKSRPWIVAELNRLDRTTDANEFSDFSAHQLALRFGISPRQLERIFETEFHCSPKAWLREKQMKFARALILRAEPVKAVAFQLGFKQPSNFCAAFKLYYRASPSEFAEKRGVAAHAGRTDLRTFIEAQPQRARTRR